MRLTKSHSFVGLIIVKLEQLDILFLHKHATVNILFLTLKLIVRLNNQLLKSSKLLVYWTI